MRLSRTVVFYFSFLVFAGVMFLTYLSTTPWVSDWTAQVIIQTTFYGAISIFWIGLFAYIAWLWRKVGVRVGLRVVVFMVCPCVFVGYLLTNHADSMKQVAISGIGLAFLVAPLVWVAIKWTVVVIAIVVAVNVLNGAIRKINRALDAVIRSKEILERIEACMAEDQQKKCL